MLYFHKWLLLLSSTWLIILKQHVVWSADDYNILNRDGSYEFGYDNPDSFHHSRANRFNVVQGQFGGRNPGTGAIDTTQYTAGPRGFRPQGKNIVRKYDLNQNGPRPIGSRDDPYFDPNEDPSYNFAFNTRTYSRKEAANRFGDVSGKYSYVDDVGERHNVEFIAGKNTGFHVKTPFPDSNPRAYGPLYFNGRGRPIPRGRTAIQRGLDGSYRFISAGPDQRRTETSDSTGHVRGSYTYLDDKGVQHSVHYIAGPETGYRVLKNVKGPHLPTLYPFGRPEIIPPDFYDYLAPGAEFFDTAASGHVKPPVGGVGGAGGIGGVGGVGGVGGASGVGGTGGIGGIGGTDGVGGTGGIGGTGGGSRPGSGGIGGGRPPRPGAGSDGDQFNFDNGSDISGGGGGTGGGDFGDFEKPGVSGGGGGGGETTGDGFGTGFDDGATGPGGSGVGSGSRPGINRPGISRPGGSRPGGSRPGGSRPGISRPPFGGGSRPPRPTYEDDGTDIDLFGATSSSSVRPPGSRPPGGRPPGGRPPGGRPPGGRPPSSTYGPPGSTFGPIDGTFKPPSSTYGPPGSTYGPPGSTYGPPGSTYGPPGSTYGPPGSTYGPPGSTFGPPSGTFGPTSSGETTDDGSYRPTGDDGSYRPGGNDGRPGGGDSGFPRPTRPTGGFPGGSRPGKPTYDDIGSNEVNDFNLFDDIGGAPGVSRPTGGPSRPPRPPVGPSRPGGGPSRPPRPPVGPSRPGGGQHIGISHPDSGSGIGGGATGGGYDDHGTIVTNVGDRLFSVPPGVSVRAHVQAIDLLPLGPRAPTPGEQLKAESNEELSAETTNIEEELNTDASSTHSTITSPSSNSTEPLAL